MLKDFVITIQRSSYSRNILYFNPYSIITYHLYLLSRFSANLKCMFTIEISKEKNPNKTIQPS
ncbi:hypothetical protein BTTAP_20160 [Brochothrix thermosphacta]|nr:hypothetical protein BTTAP_20160 [Brochothrix thermosphacta]